MAINEHSLRGTFTLWRKRGRVDGAELQRRMTATTIPTFIEYDKTVRDLPALAKGALFLRARSQYAIATVCSGRGRSI